jgi:hypothetical protein
VHCNFVRHPSPIAVPARTRRCMIRNVALSAFPKALIAHCCQGCCQNACQLCRHRLLLRQPTPSCFLESRLPDPPKTAMLRSMDRDGRTTWRIDRRAYYFERWKDGTAERVRAERHDGTRWVRVLEAVYWWPEHEGKEWPATVIPGPVWEGLGKEPDTWAHFEAQLGMDDRYRWEPLAGSNQSKSMSDEEGLG